MMKDQATFQLSRRAFIRGSTLVLSATPVSQLPLFADTPKPASSLRIAMLTDMHYADKPSAGSRHYRETLAKLEEASTQFEKDKPDVLVELGDLIDRADSVEVETKYLKTINKPFSAICKDRHYVLGNHCVDTLTKDEFLGTVSQEKSYYSFDRGDYHFVVLDSCFRSDGEPYGRKNFKWNDANIPQAEIEWLQADLKATQRKTIVFAHQRLDVSTNHGVKNNVTIRKILESSGQVQAVFQGHSHSNDVKEINGIHYCTLVAMVEGSGMQNNGYSMMTLAANGTISIDGFRKQSDYDWSLKPA